MAEIFGPVASRRLGLSLGINHLPPKTCTYSCVYCQLGKTGSLTVQRDAYSHPDEIYENVNKRLEEMDRQERKPDAITFVTNGEPTLDKNIGNAIRILKDFHIPVAVITNASLLWQEEAREDLCDADIVSVKIDSVSDHTWHQINRPHEKLKLHEIMHGILAFSIKFKGRLLTETMLISGLNDDEEELVNIAGFIRDINPQTAYLALPLRPPAEKTTRPPDEKQITAAYHFFKQKIDHVEIMAELPTSSFSEEEDAIQKLLEILRVHPLEMSEVQDFLLINGINPAELTRLREEGKVRAESVSGKYYLTRSYPPQ